MNKIANLLINVFKFPVQVAVILILIVFTTRFPEYGGPVGIFIGIAYTLFRHKNAINFYNNRMCKDSRTDLEHMECRIGIEIKKFSELEGLKRANSLTVLAQKFKNYESQCLHLANNPKYNMKGITNNQNQDTGDKINGKL